MKGNRSSRPKPARPDSESQTNRRLLIDSLMLVGAFLLAVAVFAIGFALAAAIDGSSYGTAHLLASIVFWGSVTLVYNIIGKSISKFAKPHVDAWREKRGEEKAKKQPQEEEKKQRENAEKKHRKKEGKKEGALKDQGWVFLNERKIKHSSRSNDGGKTRYRASSLEAEASQVGNELSHFVTSHNKSKQELYSPAKSGQQQRTPK